MLNRASYWTWPSNRWNYFTGPDGGHSIANWSLQLQCGFHCILASCQDHKHHDPIYWVDCGTPDEYDTPSYIYG